MKKTVLLALGGIFILAIVLRVMFLSNLSLTFGYDQARDAYMAQQIANGDLKILGPPASTPGLYHGVLYYYFLAPAYLLGHGSPIVAAYWLAFFNAATVLLVFLLAYLFTKSSRAGLISAFLFAISFEAVQYATWLSNPTLGVITVPLLYLGLWLWIDTNGRDWGKKWGPVLAGLGLGFSVQAEIFLLYQAPVVLLWLWLARKNINRRQIVSFALTLILSLSTMIISEIKFGFKGLSGMSYLLNASDAIISSKNFGDLTVLFLNQIGKVFALSSYPANIGYGAMFVIIVGALAYVSWNKKKISWQPFLLTWLISHITVVSMGGVSTPFLLVGIGPAVSIILGIFINKWASEGKKALAVIFTTLIIFGNVSMILKENPKGATIFSIQKDMILRKQLAAIDYTYQASGKNKFSVNSLTSPLWINIVWTYLYKWYGEEKYGYVPEWHGRDQVGQLDTLGSTSADTKNYYLIIEPMAGIPLRYLGETVSEEDVHSKLIEEKNFGEIIVQKRVRI